MKKPPDTTPDSAISSIGAGQALRRLAEDRLRARELNPQPAIPDSQLEARLLHELQVHQIELEVQTEELQQACGRTAELLVQYTELYDFAPVGYLTLDREGAIRQANLTCARMLGVERSLLLNRQFDRFVAEVDRRAFIDLLDRVFASDGKECCEATLLREGSLPLVVHIGGARSEDGRECRLALLDITTRKQGEEELRKQLAELHRWQNVTLGREDRVRELKREVNECCRRAGESIRYPSQEDGLADVGTGAPQS